MALESLPADAAVTTTATAIDPRAAARSIIERIMTQHWDMAACPCWICVEGRELGLGPREQYFAHKHPEQRRGGVHVDTAHITWTPNVATPPPVKHIANRSVTLTTDPPQWWCSCGLTHACEWDGWTLVRRAYG